MPMIVANNLNAINTQRNLNLNNTKMSSSLEKLSSGYKINTAKDDPAGLVISEQLRAQTVGLTRAVQNTQEANNVLGIAEGALSEMNNILKKMRQLAIHSANNGVTSPEQVAADQAEVDSSIQTLDRIARTTKYSDQFLLNGNKQLNYESSVMITDSMDMKLIDEGLSDIRQIFKRQDFKLNINFSGVTQNGTSQDVDNGNEAQKAYFEISKAGSAASQVYGTHSDSTKSYTLTKDQAFTISGNKGSRSMSFAKGTHLGEMVTSINSVVDSTGVKASLIFDSDATVQGTSSGGTQALTGTATHGSGSAMAYNRTELGEITTDGISSVQLGTTASTSLVLGKNMDGYGRMYLKMTDDDSFEIFKDEAMTMMVARGDVDASGDTTIMEANSSGVDDTVLDFTFGTASAGMTSTLQLAVFHEDSTASNSLDLSELDTAAAPGSSDFFVSEGSFFSGIKLGENTSDTGKLYIKADLSSTADSQVWVYKDARMRDEDLVAQSDTVDLSAGGMVNIYGVQMGENGPTTGLYGTLNFDSVTSDLFIESATVSAEHLGVRISAEEYGSDQFVTMDATEGAVWSRYSDTDGTILMDAGLTGTSWTEYGRDAVIALNGQQLTLEGIRGTLTNLDTTAEIAFNQGSLGNTTLATVGYDVGAWGSRAGEIYNDEDNYVTHALHSTTEVLSDWEGGMQFQLGEGAGDQERTVFSIKDMTATNLGRVLFNDKFEFDHKVDRYLSLNDMLSGGFASLAMDPVKALSVIDQSIEDVSNLRANLGAFQSNMLETNANSLNVAIENITKTESYIRDADMAYESTQFTKNQIMVQAGTSMLAQANQQQQQVLSLLG